MITNEQIKKIIEDCKGRGHTINVRDISFILLSDMFDDKSVAYKCVFGKDEDFDLNYLPAYERTACMTYLRTLIEDFLPKGNSDQPKSSYKDITFDENKAEIIKLIEKTKREEELGTVDVEKSLRIQADLRCKLNDKFKVQENIKEQMIIVNSKYNGVCEYCGHEIEKMTKEIAMNKWNLIEKES